MHKGSLGTPSDCVHSRRTSQQVAQPQKGTKGKACLSQLRTCFSTFSPPSQGLRILKPGLPPPLPHPAKSTLQNAPFLLPALHSSPTHISIPSLDSSNSKQGRSSSRYSSCSFPDFPTLQDLVPTLGQPLHSQEEAPGVLEEEGPASPAYSCTEPSLQVAGGGPATGLLPESLPHFCVSPGEWHQPQQKTKEPRVTANRLPRLLFSSNVIPPPSAILRSAAAPLPLIFLFLSSRMSKTLSRRSQQSHIHLLYHYCLHHPTAPSPPSWSSGIQL